MHRIQVQLTAERKRRGESMLAQRRLGMRVVTGIVDDLLPGIDVAYVSEDLHNATLEFFRSENRRQLSLVDCSNIVFMRRKKITRAFAYDLDFERFGLKLLTEP